VKYVKVPCRGRNEVPDPESVNTFVFEVMRFFSKLKPGEAANKYILVHCTHGHNRTGFMIIHYLMRTQMNSVEQAVRMFAKARPPGIYKQHYIDDLFTFYHEPRPAAIVYPSTPEWKRPETPDLNGIATTDQDEDDEDDFMAALQEEDPKAPMTNDDVLGDPIPDEQQREMQKMCYYAIGVARPASVTRGRCCLSRQHSPLIVLALTPAYVSWAWAASSARVWDE
jgi:mRNA-capping enzyme